MDIIQNIPKAIVRKRQRGKRAGRNRKATLQRKLPLPSIVLANARSINNKVDELDGLIKFHYAYKNASAIALTETWLHSTIDDNHIAFDGFDVYRADRDPDASNKSRGGGCLWLIRKSWCTNTTVHRRYQSKDLELLHLRCRPHYLPREINVINLFNVYIPPDADKTLASELIEDFVDDCLIKHPDSATIIVGDFNKAKLSSSLHQHVTINTRENSQLDLCYTNIPGAYKSYKLPPLGSSDHNAVQLIPIYQTKHKLTKKTKVTKQIIDDDSIDKCKAVFDTTDWEALLSENIHKSVEAVTDYVNFTLASNTTCRDFYVNTKHRPWVTPELKALFNKKNQVIKDKQKSKQIQKLINEKIAKAKADYKDKMLSCMSSNIRKAWQGIKSMSGLANKQTTNYDLMSKHEQTTLANSLNSFYTRFNSYTTTNADPVVAADGNDVDGDVAVGDAGESDGDDGTTPAGSDSELMEITVDEVRKQFGRCKDGKSSGPDNLSTKILKSCSYELAPIFCKLFNMCLTSGELPSIWKLSSIVPVPKSTSAKENNDFRPIALTSVAMKCFEHIVKKRLLTCIKLDEFQFAYRPNRSTKDACISLDYFIRSHLEKPSAYARVLFVDFSSAFNTIVPNILLKRLSELGVPYYLLSFIKAFLTDRQQYVRIGNNHSDILNCDIGAPQGCVLSPILFSIYTSFIQSKHENVKILKYADDMAIVGLLNFKTDSSFYFDAVDNFLEQCHSVNLLINAKKTKEMVLSFSRSYAIYDYLFIAGQPIDKVDHFKYLGTIFSSSLKWHENSDCINGKLRSRFYAFSKFKQFKPSQSQKDHFIRTLIFPILTYNIELWHFSSTVKERTKLLKHFDRNNFAVDMDTFVTGRINKLANNIIGSDNHILNDCYSCPRTQYLLPRVRTNRFLQSFIPMSIKVLNNRAFL